MLYKKTSKKYEARTGPFYYMNCVYTTTSTGGEEKEDSSYRTRKYITNHIQGLQKRVSQTESFERDSVEVSKEIFDAEKVYAVICFTVEGDTFGTTEGLLELDSVFLTPQAANARAEEIDKNKERGWGNYIYLIEIHGFSPKEQIPIETRFKFVNHF